MGFYILRPTSTPPVKCPRKAPLKLILELQLTDGHNNTIFIQLSRDGEYWDINSAGIFKAKYGNNKETIWSASEVQNSDSAITNNALQSEPNADEGSTSNGTASDVSVGKDSAENQNNQTKSEESLDNAENSANSRGTYLCRREEWQSVPYGHPHVGLARRRVRSS